MLRDNARNCLSYWHPRLVEAGVPTPRTEMIRTSVNLRELLDEKIPEGWGDFLAQMNMAIARLTDNASPTPPVFLRTGQGSGKHDWRHTAYLDLSKDTLASHVGALVGWSEIVDMLGLPTDVWCVRELLPVEPIVTLEKYGGMPLVREMRFFVSGGHARCWHSYWPSGAIERGFVGTREELAWAVQESRRVSPAEMAEATSLVKRVARAFADDGAWSVDVLATRRGFQITDMALAAESYHAPECPHFREFRP